MVGETNTILRRTNFFSVYIVVRDLAQLCKMK